MTQIKTTPQTWTEVMGSKAFRIGWDEVKNDLPFNEDNSTSENTDYAWNYERGRLIALDIIKQFNNLPNLKKAGRGRYNFNLLAEYYIDKILEQHTWPTPN